MSEIKITPELLADLKAKAEKATPGPWHVDEYGNVYAPNYLDVAEECITDDAQYIAAANPQVVLALIYILEQLKGMYGVSIKEISALDKEIEELEQDNASLENEADWLAKQLGQVCYLMPSCARCPLERDNGCAKNGIPDWREAARKEVNKDA